jgi:hypothetical protein
MAREKEKEKEPAPRKADGEETETKTEPPKELTRERLEEIRRKLQKKY